MAAFRLAFERWVSSPSRPDIPICARSSVKGIAAFRALA